MPSPKDMYLIAYNAGCMAGWGYALFLALTALAAGGSLTGTWKAAEGSSQRASAPSRAARRPDSLQEPMQPVKTGRRRGRRANKAG